MPMKAHENILIFYKKLPTYNPQMTTGHPLKTVKSKKADKTDLYGKQDCSSLSYNSTKRYPRSVIRFPSDKQKSSLHPTQKPVALIKWLINTYSNEGDVVLDNCMGSGTTLEACIELDRRCIGIESEKEYYNIALNRVKSLKHQNIEAE